MDLTTEKLAADAAKQEAMKASNEAAEIRARSMPAPLDYKSNRIQGLGARYPKEELTPDVENLRGTLNYDEGSYVKAVEIGKAVPEPSPSELRATLEALAKAENFRELRQQLNVQSVRLGNDKDALKEIRLAMTPLQTNHPESQAVLAGLIDEIVTRTEDKLWNAE